MTPDVRISDAEREQAVAQLREHALSLVAGIDVRRVPAAWAQRTFREIIRATRKGEHEELQA